MRYRRNRNLSTLANILFQYQLIHIILKYYTTQIFLQLNNDNPQLTNKSRTPDRPSALVEGELEMVPISFCPQSSVFCPLNAGDMLTQTDEKGITHTFTVDNLGRITKLKTSTNETISYIYDVANGISNTNTVGKLTKVVDPSGTTEYAYDAKGNNIGERKVIDDLTINFQRSYDALGRLKTITYPEGTKTEYMYTNTGQITTILMHAYDDSYRNQPVVQYIGPIQEDSKLFVRRKTGNNVVMDIEYDPIRRRPKSLKTTLAEGQTEQNVAYAYDKKGNIAQIADRLNDTRDQKFEYDALNRVTKAIGKYGTEDYAYHSNGNLLQRGEFNLQYSNLNHVHAVTKVSSLQTGDTNYTYDTTGNLTERNGDVFRYNSQNKLAEITTAGGDVFQYSYDASGNRIKKQLKNANTTTYNFNNLYEIHRSPGEPEKHTMYIHGIEGDMVAQYTRSDALLVQANVNENKYAGIFTDTTDQNSIFDQRRNFLDAKNTLISLFQEIETDLSQVWWDVPKPKLLTDNYQMLPSMRVLIWLLAFGILIYYALTLNPQEAYATRRLRLATSLALFPFFFATSAGCSPLFFGGAQGEEGTPPWLLLAAIPQNTPSVSDEPTFFGGGSGSGASSVISSRITGMYFLHPDHLGSITMITDGRGNAIAGGERGGKSHIAYRPYGEIHRTDSFGPDISKYKFTGQEEDKESGLMYYKARYYDSRIGRFLQQDSMVFPNQINGMNRMMYVEGNPVGFRDVSGCKTNYNHMFTEILKHLTGGVTGTAKNFMSLMEGADRASRNSAEGIDAGGRIVGKALDGGARWLASGGSYSRNRGNDLDATFGNIGIKTNSLFNSIEISDLGKSITKAYNWSRSRLKQPNTTGGRHKNYTKDDNDKRRRVEAIGKAFALINYFKVIDKYAGGGTNEIPLPEPGTCNDIDYCQEADGGVFCWESQMDGDGKCQK
jgi:RHS repeat-associated protein